MFGQDQVAEPKYSWYRRASHTCYVRCGTWVASPHHCRRRERELDVAEGGILGILRVVALRGRGVPKNGTGSTMHWLSTAQLSITRVGGFGPRAVWLRKERRSVVNGRHRPDGRKHLVSASAYNANVDSGLTAVSEMCSGRSDSD